MKMKKVTKIARQEEIERKKEMSQMLSKFFKRRINKTPISTMVTNALNECNDDGDGVPLARIRNFVRVEYNNKKRCGKELQYFIKEYIREAFGEGTIIMVNGDNSSMVNFTKRFDIVMDNEE